jgi:hypothetical protein
MIKFIKKLIFGTAFLIVFIMFLSTLLEETGTTFFKINFYSFFVLIVYLIIISSDKDAVK